MTSSNRCRLRRFANALAIALYDRELELSTHSITYYYDADVIFKMIVGLEHESFGTAEQRVVRALLSCGIFGDFCMVRPHAFELNEMIRRHAKQSARTSPEAFLGRARQFLDRKGIADTMSRLRSLVSGENGQGHEEATKVRRFLKILGNSPGDTFAYIEQTNGTWWERLGRYRERKLLRLDQMGPEIDELIDERVDSLRAINSILTRKRSAPNQSINVFRDALAVAILTELIRSADEGSAVSLVRFYTETHALSSQAEHDPDLRDLLSYKAPSLGMEAPRGAGLIIRDSDYYIIRAWFKELAREKPGVERLGDLGPLKELSAKLQDLIALPDHQLDVAIGGVSHQGKPLTEMLDDFGKLAIMDRVWVGERVPDYLQTVESLYRWTEVVDFLATPGTGQILAEEMKQASDELGDRVSRMQSWSRDHQRIRHAAQVMRTRASGRILDPMRDLGLVRWAYDLGPDEKAELVSTTTALLGQGDPDLTASASILATRMDAATRNPSRCMVVCASLWALGCFDEITQLVKECLHNSDDIPASLLVIQAAAQARAGTLNTSASRHKAVDRVCMVLQCQPKHRRPGLLLGVGYVLYHVWKRALVDSRVHLYTPERLAPEIQAWARRSYDLGMEAYESLPPSELAWAYSVNHCAYVGTVTGLYPGVTDQHFERLLTFERIPTLWNARFADTVGSYHLWKAIRIWHATPANQRGQLDLAGHLGLADHYFQKAKLRDIGDTDVDEHIGRLQMLRGNYNAERRDQSALDADVSAIDRDEA